MFFGAPLPSVILYCDSNHARAVDLENCADGEEGSSRECCRVSASCNFRVLDTYSELSLAQVTTYVVQSGEGDSMGPLPTLPSLRVDDGTILDWEHVSAGASERCSPDQAINASHQAMCGRQQAMCGRQRSLHSLRSLRHADSRFRRNCPVLSLMLTKPSVRSRMSSSARSYVIGESVWV